MIKNRITKTPKCDYCGFEMKAAEYEGRIVYYCDVPSCDGNEFFDLECPFCGDEMLESTVGLGVQVYQCLCGFGFDSTGKKIECYCEKCDVPMRVEQKPYGQGFELVCPGCLSEIVVSNIL